MAIETRLKKILSKHKDNTMSSKAVLREFRHLAYHDLGFARVDNHRLLRRGFPEAIYAKGKTLEQIESIARSLLRHNRMLFVTRADASVYERLKGLNNRLIYNRLAGAIYLKKKPAKTKNPVLIITAGTSDIPVAEEAKSTLDAMGVYNKTLYDVGVAGIHRLSDKRHLLNKARCIIVVAGMEGALASVVSGLISRPVVAVPTSVGYGASFKGLAALLAMLNSCSPGIACVNIDNGFGAGYFAGLLCR